MALSQKKEKAKKSGKRFLVVISFMRSAGPIRFVVSEEDLVCGVIGTALKSYAREGRLPVLGLDATNFLLYCAHDGIEALNPMGTIRSHGGRNFVLCKKWLDSDIQVKQGRAESEMIARKACWKAWFNKSIPFKISSR